MDDTAVPLANQENNQLLLNAIKNKFAARSSSEAACYSPPKFTIPILNSGALAASAATAEATHLKLLGGSQQDTVNVADNTNPTTTVTTQSMSQLNQFIMGKLHANSSASGNGFILPTLGNVNMSTTGSQLVIPTLNGATQLSKTPPVDENLSTLSSRLRQLNVVDMSASNNIDLTTALSCSVAKPQTAAVSKMNANTQLQDFDIPFIECDLKEQPVLLSISNEYCQTDVSHVKLQHCLGAPSAFARITCLKFKLMRQLPRIDHTFKAKHKIKRFSFDTQSPDDVIMASLKRFHR